MLIPKKIEEYIEAGEFNVNTDYSDWYEFSKDDLTELIRLVVQECINVIEPDDHPVDEINCRYSIIFAIKNHFGIN